MNLFPYLQKITPLFLFIITIISLGLPFTSWGFFTDDWGIVHHALIKHATDFIKFFTEGSVTSIIQPDNYLVPEQSFLAVLYRPFTYVTIYLQTLLVGTSAFGLFLITISMHACNAALFCSILHSFLSLKEAFATATLFAFHISIGNWMGWITGQSQIITLTFFLLIIVLLKKYLGKQGFIYLFIALVIHQISLFSREELIILPLWLMTTFCFFNKFLKEKYGSHSSFIILICSFTLSSFTYLAMRLSMFPFKASGEGLKVPGTLIGYLTSLSHRFFDLVTFMVDAYSLSMLPAGNRLFKGTMLLIISIGVCFLFLKNNRKKHILYCLTSLLLLMWPALYRFYASRFLYLSLPFLVLIYLQLFQYTTIKRSSWLKDIKLAWTIMAMSSIGIVYTQLKQREGELSVITNAFNTLLQDKSLLDKKLCFIGLPYEQFVTGIAQAIRLYTTTIPAVYYDNTTFVWTQNISDPITITKSGSTFSLITNDASHAWFLFTNSCMPMGHKMIIHQDKEKIYAFSYSIDQKYLTQECVWITWDYQKKLFVRII